MAAKGAAILLREQLTPLARFLARLRVRKPVIREQSPNRFIAAFERYIPRRVGIAATILMLLGSSVALGVVKGDHLEAVTEFLSDSRNAAANAAGFRIASVTLNGRK
ncbi:MAG: cell division protein FtsQ/DivIB, partial [Tardiphaga sp.]